MNRWKLEDITALVKWIFTKETIDREGVQQKSSGSGRRFGRSGFVGWLLSTDQLDEEPEGDQRVSRLGKGGFLGWLLSADDLQEEPQVEKETSRFGEKGFVRWLLRSDNLQDSLYDEEEFKKRPEVDH